MVTHKKNLARTSLIQLKRSKKWWTILGEISRQLSSQLFYEINKDQGFKDLRIGIYRIKMNKFLMVINSFG